MKEFILSSTTPEVRVESSTKPFQQFASSVLSQSDLRAAITAAYRRPETECLPPLLELANPGELRSAIADTARDLVTKLREKRTGGGVDGLIHEYSLSSEEGIALMCLAEALLRIPDNHTRDALIKDKIAKGDWKSHLGSSSSMFVNAVTWGLMITGKLVRPQKEASLSASLTKLIARGGEPLIRKGVDQAMHIMGEHFVRGETIEKALSNGKSMIEKGFNYSFDMLGEAAMTDEDALRYYKAYEDSIHAIGKAATGRDVYEKSGISIKLSALHARYSRSQIDRVMEELYPRLRDLTFLAHKYDIGINIDAEEADRLEISLDLLEKLCHEPQLAGWKGIGFVVQAYSKRTPFVIDWLIDLARRTNRRLMIRLVKGAYWDTEIKRAQVDGLDGYPLYTRKFHTDVSYLACARKLLAAKDEIFPQFASHNAQTLGSIYHMAGPDFYHGKFEFQCLHGMGEPLYEEVVGDVKDGKLGRPCRIYAPVGTHETLLAYLVRRLLENGANSSFVNRITDENVSIDDLIVNPVDEALAVSPVGSPHEMIPLPRDLYKAQGQDRLNSRGIDLSNEQRLRKLADGLTEATSKEWVSMPTGLESVATDSSRAHETKNPADHSDTIGRVAFATKSEAEQMVTKAETAFASWSSLSASDRAGMLQKAADIIESKDEFFIALAVREAGKSFSNAVAEIREAVDFLRYYSYQVETKLSNPQNKPLGPVVCISPWNFPLAIFMGQISAALSVGNVVLAKPAEQTPLIAYYAVEALHEAGIPKDVVQLVPGAGDIGAALVADERVKGVMFTGSTAVAQSIAKVLSNRSVSDGKPIPLIAETGGLNAMIVDSSALAEQVVVDVVSSAFDSAGQRCSALRILCVQEDVADSLLTMLKGNMDELKVGNPDRLSTDVGPVIDAEAQKNILDHIEHMRSEGFKIHQTKMDDSVIKGTFVAPTLIEVNDVTDVKKEVFGPVLHVVRFNRRNLNELIDKINLSGYGLTFGMHSRINESVDDVSSRVKAGNLYINRNIIGAVVGVQPFGGMGLSGTGPKAGGPLYQYRLLAEGGHDCVRDVLSSDPLSAKLKMPTPTGEENFYFVRPRGNVLCLAQTAAGARAQLEACSITGNNALFAGWPDLQSLNSEVVAVVGRADSNNSTNTLNSSKTSNPSKSPKSSDASKSTNATAQRGISIYKNSNPSVSANIATLLSTYRVDAVLVEGDAQELKQIAKEFAQNSAIVIQPQALSTSAIESGAKYDLERLLVEQSLSVNTAAAGGNATLMAVV